MATQIGEWTLDLIKTANRVRGNCFFSPDTMKFWHSRVSETIHQGVGGVFIVTSEANFNRTKRLYTVRHFNPKDGHIRTKCFQQFCTARRAHQFARQLAGGKFDVRDWTDFDHPSHQVK